jgi:hypothetical protein
MKIILIFLAVTLLSCTHKEIDPRKDIIDQLISLRKTNSINDLKAMFGEPEEIKSDPRVPSEITWFYKKHLFEVGVSPKTNKILGTALYFWKDFDNYKYLKERFKNYKWEEHKLPTPKGLDYASDLRKVVIPELGITFEYDDLSFPGE